MCSIDLNFKDVSVDGLRMWPSTTMTQVSAVEAMFSRQTNQRDVCLIRSIQRQSMIRHVRKPVMMGQTWTDISVIKQLICWDWKARLYFSNLAGEYSTIESENVFQIQQEIFKFGPVVAIMDLYDDLTMVGKGTEEHNINDFIVKNDFKSKRETLVANGCKSFQKLRYFPDTVYVHIEGVGKSTGWWHAVRLLGWGETENGIPYWLCSNSWGTGVHDQGVFKMIRGRNHLGIETVITYVYPREAWT